MPATFCNCFCAASGLSQKLGSRVFSSSFWRSILLLSMSKTPPQRIQTLYNVLKCFTLYHNIYFICVNNIRHYIITTTNEQMLITIHRITPCSSGFIPTCLRSSKESEAPIKNIVSVRSRRAIPFIVAPICG